MGGTEESGTASVSSSAPLAAHRAARGPPHAIGGGRTGGRASPGGRGQA